MLFPNLVQVAESISGFFYWKDGTFVGETLYVGDSSRASSGRWAKPHQPVSETMGLWKLLRLTVEPWLWIWKLWDVKPTKASGGCSLLLYCQRSADTWNAGPDLSPKMGKFGTKTLKIWFWSIIKISDFLVSKSLSLVIPILDFSRARIQAFSKRFLARVFPFKDVTYMIIQNSVIVKMILATGSLFLVALRCESSC